MECEIIERYDSELNPVTKPKRKFETLDEAIIIAKKINSNDHTIRKVVAYKCKKCFKYHIGRNGKELTEKERTRFKNQKK